MKHTIYILSVLFLWSVLLSDTVLAQQVSESGKDSVIAGLSSQLRDAVLAGDSENIASLAYQLEPFTKKDEQFTSYAQYHAAHAYYRLATIPGAATEKQIDGFLNKAQDHLESAIDSDPEFAEAHILLSSIYGMKAAGFISGMKYGPRAQSATEKARSLAPDNPRLHLIEGIGNIYKPKMFGGGIDRALESIEKAIALYPDDSPSSPLDPDWGHAEAYAWLGQIHEMNGDSKKARDAFIKALEIEPEYQWVKYELLPALETK